MADKQICCRCDAEFGDVVPAVISVGHEWLCEAHGKPVSANSPVTHDDTVLWNHLIGHMTPRTIKFMIEDLECAFGRGWSFERCKPGPKLKELLRGLHIRNGTDE